MNSNVCWTACVLAGGLSSRMGRDKGALIDPRRGGLSCVDATAAALDAAGAARVLVSGEHPSREAVADRWSRRGPLGGIASVLEHMTEGELLLVVPVDMPLLVRDDFDRLVWAVERGSRAAFHHGWPLPFAVRCSASALRLAQARLEFHAADASVHGWLRDLEALVVDEPKVGARFVSFDTPLAWAAYVGARPC